MHDSTCNSKTTAEDALEECKTKSEGLVKAQPQEISQREEEVAAEDAHSGPKSAQSGPRDTDNGCSSLNTHEECKANSADKNQEVKYSDQENVPASNGEAFQIFTTNYIPASNDTAMGYAIQDPEHNLANSSTHDSTCNPTSSETISNGNESDLEEYDITQQSAYKSENEKQREENIEENHRVMLELGMIRAKRDYKQSGKKAQSPTKEHSTVKRTKNKSLSEEPPARRRSQRIQTRKLISQSNEDKGDTRTTEDAHERKAQPQKIPQREDGATAKKSILIHEAKTDQKTRETKEIIDELNPATETTTKTIISSPELKPLKPNCKKTLERPITTSPDGNSPIADISKICTQIKESNNEPDTNSDSEIILNHRSQIISEEDFYLVDSLTQTESETEGNTLLGYDVVDEGQQNSAIQNARIETRDPPVEGDNLLTQPVIEQGEI